MAEKTLWPVRVEYENGNIVIKAFGDIVGPDLSQWITLNDKQDAVEKGITELFTIKKKRGRYYLKRPRR